MADTAALTDVIAIDGPAGAGKSSVAREVARRLGMRFLDTGAMYRAATWRAMHHHLDLYDPRALAESTNSMTLELADGPEGPSVFVDGQDITREIRTREVTENIRRLDGVPGVRDRLVTLQREFAARGPTVAEGRDMGTVVFPMARCKIFLDASVDERTNRRALQLEQEGRMVDRASLKRDIAARDDNDRTRAIAPLRAAEDAVIVDTTNRTFEDVVAEIVHLAEAAV